jgi:hypothetical protein
MTMEHKALVIDLIEWIEREPRTYQQVLEAWRTSCPRLTVWEDALEAGFIACEQHDARGTVVNITPAGRAFIDGERRTAAAGGAEVGKHTTTLA